MKDWVDDLAPAAGSSSRIGDCASWGGLPAVPPNPSRRRPACSSTRERRAASSARTSVSKAGLPVINIPGCPAHPDWITPDHRGAGHRPGRRPHARRAPAPEDVLHDVHPDRLHPQCSSSSTSSDHRVRPGHAHRLPVLRVRLPRPDDALAVQPHPVEPPVVEDPRRASRAPAAPSRSSRSTTSSRARCSRPRRSSGVIPKDVPDRAWTTCTYMAAAAAARIAAPQWSKEDMFVV